VALAKAYSHYDRHGPTMKQKSSKRMRSIHLSSIRDIGWMGNLLSVKLRSVQVFLSRGLSDLVNEEEIKPGYISSLSLIGANPGISQLEVGEATGIDRTTMVEILDELESRGWVVRKKSETDRRRYLLFSTSKGDGELKRIVLALQRTENEMLSQFPAEDLEQFLQLLERMRQVTIDAIETAELAMAEGTKRQI
jgi:DNA-binding MarR family transcriptional regulator